MNLCAHGAGVVLMIGIATAVLQSSIFGFASMFPPIYSQAIMAGNGVAGIIASVLRILTKVRAAWVSLPVCVPVCGCVCVTICVFVLPLSLCGFVRISVCAHVRVRVGFFLPTFPWLL